MKNDLPTNAIVAVTLNCNSKCLMCDIWKNSNKKLTEISPEIFLKLPNSLKDINITGGEPFLRPDLPQIIKNIKKTSPNARILINTNGFLSQIIEKQIKEIIKIDPKIAIRVSLDATDNLHSKIRGIPNGFKKALSTISILKKNNVKDLGISSTIMDINYSQLQKIYDFAVSQKLELSFTLVSDSPIYFGNDKSFLRPKNQDKFQKIFFEIIKKRYQTQNPKNWFRSWFEEKLFDFYKSQQRFFPCDAGSNFFYMDSHGNIFPCHLKNQPIGNLTQKNFNDIWFSQKSEKIRNSCLNCNQCWQICTAKTSIKKNLLKISLDIFSKKIQSLWQ